MTRGPLRASGCRPGKLRGGPGGAHGRGDLARGKTSLRALARRLLGGDAMRFPRLGHSVLCALLSACAGFPDAAPETSVVVDNRYSSGSGLVIYDAHWQNVSLSGQPVAPGASSAPESTVPASADNTAYVLLAPGWDPTSANPPTAFILLQSRRGFSVELGDTLHLPVDDTTFTGNCAAGDALTAAQADFLMNVVFPGDTAGYDYDAATCTTTVASSNGDGHAP